MIEALLRGGADVNAKKSNSGGYEECALHIASDFGYNDLVDCLLNHGAIIDLRTNVDSFTPLATAIWRNKPETVKLLLQRGADTSVLNAANRTILHISAAFSDHNTMQALTNAELSSVDHEALDSNGQTACQLFWSREDRSLELTKAFDQLLNSVRKMSVESMAHISLTIGTLAEKIEVQVKESKVEEEEDNFFETCEIIEC